MGTNSRERDCWADSAAVQQRVPGTTDPACSRCRIRLHTHQRLPRGDAERQQLLLAHSAVERGPICACIRGWRWGQDLRLASGAAGCEQEAQQCCA